MPQSMDDKMRLYQKIREDFKEGKYSLESISRGELEHPIKLNCPCPVIDSVLAKGIAISAIADFKFDFPYRALPLSIDMGMMESLSIRRGSLDRSEFFRALKRHKKRRRR
jgi:hypothetical protein